MMTAKTIEELKKELHNARAAVSYHKNKHKPKRKKGESPQAKANRLAANIAWNDRKRAMAHVIACITANDADYKDAYAQAYKMSVEEVRELTKGHEAEVEKQIKVLQERREARQQQEDIKKMIDEAWPDESTSSAPEPTSIRSSLRFYDTEHSTQKNSQTKVLSEALSYSQACEAARQVVQTNLGIPNLTNTQVIEYVLRQYVKDNS